MKKNIIHSLRKISLIIFMIATVLKSTDGQNQPEASGQHTPFLSPLMVNQYISIYEFILEINLNREQKYRLQAGLSQYWKIKNQEAIGQVISDLKYYGRQDELELLRKSSQGVIVEAFRRDIADSVSAVFIEAYDTAYPERAKSTRAKGFTDLVGTWKRTDGLIAERGYNSQASGISFTESETIIIYQDGKFKRTKVHNHYSGNCSRLDGKTEFGRISVQGTKLLFEIQYGSEIINDACYPQFNQKKRIKSSEEILTWVIKANSESNHAFTLCINVSDSTAVCFEKQ